MKDRKYNRTSWKFLLLMLFMIGVHPLIADETQSDNFSSSLNGWSGGSLDGGTMVISRDGTATKTYNFGATYANADVVVSFDVTINDKWETGKDTFNALVNGTNIYSGNQLYNNTYSKSFSVKADSSGNVKVQFNPDTNNWREKAWIDNVSVTAKSAQNELPIITTPTEQTAYQGVYYEYQVQAYDPEGGALTYHLYWNPSGISINKNTGLVSGTPTNTLSRNQIGVYVLDEQGGRRDAGLYLTVINRPPVLADVAPQTANVNQPYSFTIPYPTDPDGNPITEFGIYWLPNGLSFNSATGEISGTPTQTGTYSAIEYYARSLGQYASKTFQLSIVEGSGTPPVMGTVPDQNVTKTEETLNLSISNYVTQTDGDAITSYSLTGTLPIGMSFDTTTGVLSGSSAQIGTFDLSIKASDKDGESNSTSFSVTVGGTPPTVGAISTQTVTENSVVSIDFTGYATKTENDRIVGYTLDGTLPAGLSFSGGVLSGTPTETGTFNLSLIAMDIDGESEPSSFDLVVQANAVLENGLNATYYNNKTWSNTPLISRIDPTVDFDWGDGDPGGGLSSNNFSVRWEGYIYIPEDGDYTFSLKHDDDIKLTIDGEELYYHDTWSSNSYRDATTKSFAKGYYPITIEFIEKSGGAHAHFRWRNNGSISSNVIVPSSNLFPAKPEIVYVENADDLCYSESTYTGMMCMDMGMCKGGIGCKTTIPLDNIGDGALQNVEVYYKEDGMSGTMANSCEVQPSGTCSTQNDIDMGPFGMMGTATKFNFASSITTDGNNEAVATTATMSMSCLAKDNLYAIYEKNGILYRGEVKACPSTDENSSLDDESIPSDSANVLPAACGTFEDGLQTRAIDSRVDFSSGSGKLYNNPDSTLNTYATPLNGDAANANTCQNILDGSSAQSCQPSMHAAKIMSDPSGGMKYPSVFSLARPVTDTSTSKHYGEFGGTATRGEVLTEGAYNVVSSDWNGGWGITVISFEVPTVLAVNSIKNGSSNAIVTFASLSGSAYQFTVDTLQTKENASFSTTDTLAKNIKIGTISSYDTLTQGSANVVMELSATQTIKIEKLYTGHSSSYTLSAPYVNINTIKDVSGVGQTNTINIRADYVDIGDFEVGDATTINISPYTAGRSVVVKMNTFHTGSNNTITFAEGTYYIKTLNTQGSGSGYRWNMSGKVSLILQDDYETTSEIAINGDQTGGSSLCSDTHSASDLTIFSYGNIYVHNDSRIVGVIYAKGDVTLGSASYIKGAVSAENFVKLENATEVCYDSSLAADYGACDGNDTNPEPELGVCGIFPSALQTYNTLHFGGGQGGGSDTTVINVDNIVAKNTDPALAEGETTTSEAACTDSSGNTTPCEVKPPNPIDFNVPFKTTSDEFTYNISSDTTVSTANAGNYKITKKDVTLTFSATEEYSSGRKYMMIGHLSSTVGGVHYTFEEGDYYIKSWQNGGNGMVIKGNGRVRIFVAGEIVWEKNDVTINAQDGIASNFFIFAQSGMRFTSSGASHFDMTAFFYTKGDFILNGNSDSGEGITGGITAEGDISIQNNQKFTYDPRGLDGLGMGACNVFVQFSKNRYTFKEPAIDGMVEYIEYEEVNITLTEAVDYDVVVEYETFDGDPFDERIHATAIYDYIPNSPNPMEVKIPAGDINALVKTSISRDNLIENDETFFAKIKLLTTGKDVGLGQISETNLTIAIQTEEDVPLCFEDDFNGVLDDKWRTLSTNSDTYEPHIVDVNGDGRLQLTDRAKNRSTAVTKDYYFLAKWNLIEVEYLQYAYGGCGNDPVQGSGLGTYGADGIVMVLFDSQVGHSPEVGSFGGSMGYANRTGKQGFEGGWIGLGIDEYGNFSNPSEGRNGGIGFFPNNVTIRGSGGDLSGSNRYSGYRYLAGDVFGSAAPVAAYKRYNDPSFPGDKYKLRVDARDPAKLLISLYRDRGNQGTYTTVVPEFDAKDPIYQQSPTPERVRLAFTSGTGGGCNNHEIDDLSVKGVCRVYSPDVYNKGPFDAWNTDSDIGDKIIRTKIVAQSFDLWLNSLNQARDQFELKEKIHDGFPFFEQAKQILVDKDLAPNLNAADALLKTSDIEVEYDLVDASSGDIVNSPVIANQIDNGDNRLFNATKNLKEIKSFQVNGVFRQARVRFRMCADYNASMQPNGIIGKYTVYPFDACPADSIATVDEPDRLAYRLVYSEDAFAIRPNNFAITIPDVSTAMSPTTMWFQARGANNIAAFNYNESQTNSFDVQFKNVLDKETCAPDQNISLTPNINFNNGVGDGSYSISHIGLYDINISEIVGQEFAIVDDQIGKVSGRQDTVISQRLITPAAVRNRQVIPARFDVNVTSIQSVRNNGSTPSILPFTYLSDFNLNMDVYTRLSLTVSVLRGDGSIATNYDRGCYAQLGTLSFDYNTSRDVLSDQSVGRMEYFSQVDSNLSGAVELNTVDLAQRDTVLNSDLNRTLFIDHSDGNKSDTNSVQHYLLPLIALNAQAYNQGIVNVQFNFNFEKILDKPINPFTLTFNDFNVTDAFNISGAAGLTDSLRQYRNSITTYVYARVRASDDVYEDVAAVSIQTPISTDLYCEYNATVCSRLLGFTVNSQLDQAWYLNTSFNSPLHGIVNNAVILSGDGYGPGNIAPQTNIQLVSGTQPNVTVANGKTGANRDNVVGVQLQPDAWLRYDRTNAMGFYSYEVEFIGDNKTGSWSGVGDTGEVIENNASISTTRDRMNW